MIHFSRLVAIAMTTTLGCVALAPQARATNNDTMQLASLMQGSDDYLLHSAQGYLGVGIRDVDADRATALKLKQAQGAEIVYLDQDAPASKAGLRVHDVIVQMNGQQVEGVEQLRRMLHETPPGRAVSFTISRDGAPQSINLQLEDRMKLEEKARANMFVVPEPEDSAPFEAQTRPRAGSSNSFFGGSVTMGSRVDGGVAVHPINPQLAEYFGDKEGSGLLVESVEDNSAAAAAGLKVGDVIVKVNEDVVGTRNEWLRAIHANRGKTVQVTVLRNKREQVLNMQAGDTKKKSELEYELLGPQEPNSAIAELRGQLDGLDIQKLTADADALRQSAGSLDLPALRGLDSKKLREEIRKSAEDWRKSLDELKLNLNDLGQVWALQSDEVD